MKNTPAFTLVEILLVVALLGLLALPAYFSYARSRANQELTVSAEMIAATLRQAHVFSLQAKELKQWGVKSQSATSYALVSRISKDEVVEKTLTLEPNTKLIGTFSVWFAKGTGEAKESTVRLQNTNKKQFSVQLTPTGTVSIVPL